MTRHEVREEVFKVLFQKEFYSDEEMTEQMANFLNEEPEAETNREEIEETVNEILKVLPEIDKLVNDVAEGWKTERMAKVDLTLIRLAVYEIRFKKIPEGVAINEAVEIAKEYGSDRSGSFVNGILAKVV